MELFATNHWVGEYRTNTEKNLTITNANCIVLIKTFVAFMLESNAITLIALFIDSSCFC